MLRYWDTKGKITEYSVVKMPSFTGPRRSRLAKLDVVPVGVLQKDLMGPVWSVLTNEVDTERIKLLDDRINIANT